MSGQNFMAIRPVGASILQSGPKRWTDRTNAIPTVALLAWLNISVSETLCHHGPEKKGLETPERTSNDKTFLKFQETI